MSKKCGQFFFVMVVIFLLSGASVSAQKKKSVRDLPEYQRKWLTEDVVHIISPKEKEVFLQLETTRERDIFIEAFWKQRDPTPNTPNNEFKEEHYRRIGYANQHFGRESPEPGWRSDMGRIYIILGQAKYEEKFENRTEVYPTIIWFYEGMIEYGLPNAFYVVFFKEEMAGEYKLYTPIKYGPQRLLTHFWGDVKDYQEAYSQLSAVSAELADVSISLIPGETAMLSTLSIASDILISARIPAAAYAKVNSAYAEKLLMYKDVVDVEYSANYMDSDGLLDVIRDGTGIFFVHYLIEPKRLTFEESQNQFQTWLEVSGRVSDSKGTTIHQFDNTVPIVLTGEQLANVKAKLFSYQDVFPLLPGKFKFNLLLKNSVSKEFTSYETDIMIPDTSSPQIGSLLLANRLENDPRHYGKNKPFQVGTHQLLPSPRNDFVSADTIHLFFQILGLTPDLRESGTLEYSIFNEQERKVVRQKSLKDYPEAPNFLESFAPANLTPGYYTIRVALQDQDKKEILAKQAVFTIAYQPSLPRPWVLSLSQPGPADPSYANQLGNQYLVSGNLSQARLLLGEAYGKNPRAEKYALDYCRALFQGKEYERIKQVARPYLQAEEKSDFLEILGRSCQALGEFAEAIGYYKSYLAHFGTNILVLNSIGECYYQMGEEKEALVAWEKSLELNPRQEELKSKVLRIKGR